MGEGESISDVPCKKKLGGVRGGMEEISGVDDCWGGCDRRGCSTGWGSLLVLTRSGGVERIASSSELGRECLSLRSLSRSRSFSLSRCLLNAERRLACGETASDMRLPKAVQSKTMNNLSKFLEMRRSATRRKMYARTWSRSGERERAES